MAKENPVFSVSSAFSYLDKAQQCLELLDRVKNVLKFEHEIKLLKNDSRSGGYCVQFTYPQAPCSMKGKSRFLFIQDNDNLAEDLYSCILVRVQEAGGILELPDTQRQPRF